LQQTVGEEAANALDLVIDPSLAYKDSDPFGSDSKWLEGD
jgi:hypothetical protein